MTALKGLALAAALIVSTSSLAMAQAQGSSGPDGQSAGQSSTRRMGWSGAINARAASANLHCNIRTGSK